jgi:hypothetical protein
MPEHHNPHPIHKLTVNDPEMVCVKKRETWNLQEWKGNTLKKTLSILCDMLPSIVLGKLSMLYDSYLIIHILS